MSRYISDLVIQIYAISQNDSYLLCGCFFPFFSARYPAYPRPSTYICCPSNFTANLSKYLADNIVDEF